MIMQKKVKISRLFLSGEDGMTPHVNTRTLLDGERLMLGSVSASIAGCGLSRPDIERAGIIVGIDNAIDKVKESYFMGVVKDGPLGASPLLFPYTSANVLAARATIHFGIKGQDITIVSGPLSFLKAVSYAYCLVSSGRIDIAIVAGVTEAVAAAVVLGLDISGCFINSAVESRADGVEEINKSQSMSDTFSLLEGALTAGGEASVEAVDPSGNMVRISLGFENGPALKEEAFA